MQVLEESTLLGSAEEMHAFGKAIAKKLPPIVCFEGDLGAGKTTLIKGIISALTGLPHERIVSPTFNFVNEYGSAIYHFDLYRLEGEKEMSARGIDEMLEMGTLCLVEWPDRGGSLLQKELTLSIEILDNGKRQIRIKNGHIEL